MTEAPNEGMHLKGCRGAEGGHGSRSAGQACWLGCCVRAWAVGESALATCEGRYIELRGGVQCGVCMI